MKPTVAIVGRPNVGKSTLFNKLTGKRVSIVEDVPGVTRDRVYCDAEWCGHEFTLIDTGGLEIKSEDKMWRHIRLQADMAVDLADVIVLLVDGKAGLTAGDRDVAQYLRKSKKPVIVAVNKLDNNEQDKIYDFYELGMDEVIGISAEQGKGLGDLLDEITKGFALAEEGEEEGGIKIAVVGKPNAGKSSLLNLLIGDDRAIVTEVAGTTRDVLEETILIRGICLNVMDTAGIRPTSDVVERIGVEKARKYAKEADLIIYVVDSSVALDENDEEIIEFIRNKKAIVLLNKSDLSPKVEEEELAARTGRRVIRISAALKMGVEELEQEIADMFFHGDLSFNDEIYITNARQKAALIEASDSLSNVLESISNDMPEDFYSIDLMNAYEELGRITGESVDEDLIDMIFREFCMGK